MDVQIVERPFGVDTQRFLDVAQRVYKDDPSWVAPLDMDMGDRMNPIALQAHQEQLGCLLATSNPVLIADLMIWLEPFGLQLLVIANTTSDDRDTYLSIDEAS